MPLSRDILRARHQLLADIRQFFYARDVLEVETPLLSATNSPDPNLAPLAVGGGYLQTSPEFWMKRLLAAGSGDIFQIGKAFRAGDHGSRHHSEFTLLEWYRTGFDHWRLMQEVCDLLAAVASVPAGVQFSYAELFAQHCGIDVWQAPVDTLRNVIAMHDDVSGIDMLDREQCLDFLFASRIEPLLGGSRERPCVDIVYHFLPEQAALARLIDDRHGHRVAARFEVFVSGIELANAYWELADAGEQRKRWEAENVCRKGRGLPVLPLDEALLGALGSVFPDCAGCALGIDRLLMIRCGARDLGEVMLREDRLRW